MSAACEHLEGIAFEDFVATECPDCVAAGDTWVNLRQCVGCGYVGCCDSSKNRHASGHAAETGHLLVRSAMPGELWVYCYEHQAVAQP